MTADMIAAWLASATDEQLKTKVDEYEASFNTSPRDSEMRAKLKNRCEAELARRSLVSPQG